MCINILQVQNHKIHIRPLNDFIQLQITENIIHNFYKMECIVTALGDHMDKVCISHVHHFK